MITSTLHKAVYVALIISWQLLHLSGFVTQIAVSWAKEGESASKPLSGSQQESRLLSYRAFLPPNRNTHLFIIEPEQLQPTNLTNDSKMDVLHSVWSPDGQAIAFTSYLDGNIDVYIYFLNDHTTERITENPGEDYLNDWSPDGIQLLIASDQTGSLQLYSIDVENWNQKRLTDYESPCNADGARWSPDGRKIAFELFCGRNAEIFVLDIASGESINVSNDPGLDYQISWTPDSKSLAFLSSRDGDDDIYLIHADGTNLQQLTDNDYRDGSPDWSPDGDKIVFASAVDGKGEIMMLDLQTNELVRLTNHPALDRTPTWSPDGSQIAFVSDRDSNDEIFIMSIDGQNLQQITFTDGNASNESPQFQPRNDN